MMKLFKPLLALSVIMLIFSCSSDDVQSKTETETHLNCGNEDSEIDKRHQILSNWTPPSPCEASELKVFIDPSCDNSDWIAAIDASIDAYEAIEGSSLAFTTTTVQSDADIVIDCQNTFPPPYTGAAGLGYLPFTDGVIGSRLSLNLAAIGWCEDSDNLACYLQHVVMHEIGHTLGLAHNRDVDFTETGIPIDWIEGTSPNDGMDDYGELNAELSNASIMNKYVGCDAVCNFNDNDIIAFQTIYPEATIEGPECIEIGDTEEFCYTGVEDIPNGQVEWTLNNSSSTPSVGVYCNSFTFNEAGTHTISAEFCVNGCCEVVTKTVVVINPDDKCYCVCDAVETYDDSPFIQYIEIDCCDQRSCAEIMSGGGWGDIVPYAKNDCVKVTNPCTGTPLQYSISGPTEVCEEDGFVTICVSGFSRSTNWSISGPNGNETESSSTGCLSFDIEPGTYQFSTRICEGDCCQTLTHTLTVTSGPCEEECYCVCEESDGKGGYTIVELPIDCSEDCAEQYPEGDEYFECRKMFR